MKNKTVLLTALLCLILCISAVNAEDINQTENDLEISDSDILSDGDAKTFSDLSQDIKSETEKLDLTNDYKFNNATDKNYTNGIKIITQDNKNYTINGNNHVIDANHQSGIFNFINGSVTINNLKIINSNTSAIIIQNCMLTTNNVTFEDNFDGYEGSAVYAVYSAYISKGDKFINNYAESGSSIYGIGSEFEINNTLFKNDKAIHWSLIYSNDGYIDIFNCTFENITSRYATVVYAKSGKLIVTYSRFVNLYANATGGAIGAKQTSQIIIKECEFINVSSAKNGGAIFADINGNKVSKGTVEIGDTLFENCSSEFGGAYLQLGGSLTIMNSYFINNTASYSGGAIYCANTTSLIGNSKFKKNTVEYFYGSAIYADDSASQIISCDFIDNKANIIAGGIYLYDSKYEIRNCYFKNNTEAIISYYDRTGSYQKNNQLNGDGLTLKQKDAEPYFEYEGKQFVINQTTVTGSASDSSFDLRDFNLTGPVKNQGTMGSCWAFAATGALESAFLKATGILLDLSENNVQNSGLRYGVYGNPDLFEGGYVTTGMGLFLSWLGVISTADDTYDELGKISLIMSSPDSYHIQNAVIIPPRQSTQDNTKLKEALVKYGALAVYILGADANNEYYNSVTHAQYYNGKGSGNHFVTLVGWNDTYSRNNFISTPAGDGAWICKNSWGSDWGDNGFFYVSYYDTSFAMKTYSVGYKIDNNESYSKVYQYDVGALDNFYYKSNSYFNVYTASGDDLISAVGTYFENAGEAYTIDIAIDGNIVYTQSGKSTHGGFETIKLNKKVAVSYGQEIGVNIKAKAVPVSGNSKLHFEPEHSFIILDGEEYDLYKSGATACIKVYAINNPNPSRINSQYYTKSNTITVNSNAEGKTITIEKDGKTLGSAVVSGGKATFSLSLKPGYYTIVTPCNDTYIVESLEIKNTINTIDKATIGLNTDLVIDFQFLDKYGIGLNKNQKISASLDGKGYTKLSLDDNKGNLAITLFDLSLGKHTFSVINPATLEEKTVIVNVVSRFSGNANVNMYYGDGSKFKVLIYGNEGEIVGANQIVTVKLNKVTYKVKTNSKGYAVFKIPTSVKPGTYKLTATYKGQTIKNTVKVKKVLTLTKVKKVKKSAKKLVLKATLKKGKTPIKNKKLTFKFNGKKYTAKTNKKGIAKVTIKKSVLKKLKVGKKVKYQVTYLKYTLKKTVKVKK